MAARADVASHELDHGHEHRHGHGDATPARLAWAAALNGGFGIVQVVGGLVIGSVAVLADAAHQGADALGLFIALVAALLARRPPSDRRTFGWGRADALGAQLSASLLLASIAWLAWESVDRLSHPVEVGGAGISAFGVAGIAVNTIGIALLAGAHPRGAGTGGEAVGGGLAVRAARMHLLVDLGGSAAVLVAGVGVAATGADWIDPVASLLIAAAAVVATVSLLRESADVLLDRAPAHLDLEQVTATIAGEPGVAGVHHVHVWSLGAGEVALSAHVQLSGDLALHEAQERTRGFEQLLEQRHGIGHTTLQVECHDCEAPEH